MEEDNTPHPPPPLCFDVLKQALEMSSVPQNHLQCVLHIGTAI